MLPVVALDLRDITAGGNLRSTLTINGSRTVCSYLVPSARSRCRRADAPASTSTTAAPAGRPTCSSAAPDRAPVTPARPRP